MQFPSWYEFNEKVNKFENKINEKIIEFKEDYPLLDKAVNEILPYLPPPFNGIAQSLYNSFEGNNMEKIKNVLDSLRDIKEQGEEHYEKISMNLDTILIQIKDIKLLIENEQGTKNICMLFGSKIESIDNEIIKIGENFGIKLDVIHQDILKNQNKLDEVLAIIKPEKNIPVGEKGLRKEISTEYTQRLVELYEENKKLHKKLEKPKKYIEEVLLHKLSVSFYYAGKYDTAINILDEILSKNKRDVHALGNKATVLNRMSKFKDALACATQVLRLEPSFHEMLLNKGIALRHLRKFSEALDCYEKLISKEPSFSATYSSKAVTLAEMEEYEEAIKFYNKSLDLSPDDPSAIYGSLGLSQIYSGKIDEGMESFDKGLKLNSKCSVCLNNKAIGYGMKGDKDKELELLDQVIEMDPNHFEALNNKGYDLIYMDRVKESLDYFNRALNIFPQYVFALTNKSLAELKLNMLDKSLVTINAALKIDSNYKIALFWKACILCQNRDFEESKNILRKILSKNPNMKKNIIEEPLLMGLSTDNEFLRMIR